MTKKTLLYCTATFVLLCGCLCVHAQISPLFLDSLRRQAEAGDADASYRFALYAKEQFQLYGKTQDLSDYTKYMFQAANANHIPAKLEGASLMLNKEMQVNHPIAIKWLNELIRRAPHSGFTLNDIFKAYYLLGISYENGYGVRPDQALAFKHYAVASILDGDAKLALAKYFIRGTVVKKNLDSAFLLIYSAYLKDRSQLEEIAQIVATAELINGFEKYLEKQAEYGDSDAYYLLGSNMLDGKIFAYQRLKGLTHLKKAVEMNNPHAILLMGKVLQNGLFGEEKNMEQALIYFERAFYNKSTQKEALKYLVDYEKEQKNYEKAFDYYVMANDYEAAKELLPLLPQSPQTESKDLYLKVKDYRKTLSAKDPKTPQLYQERLRMAANAGYPFAVIEYAKLLKDYSKLIQVMEENVRQEDPQYYYELSQYYRAGGEKNALRNAAKALYYLQEAAERFHVPALQVLEKAYRAGNQSLNVKPNAEKQKYYAQQLLVYDIDVQRKDFFQSYLQNISKNYNRSNTTLKDIEGIVQSELAPLYRSVPHSAFAAYQLASYHDSGLDFLMIPVDPVKALLLLHLSVEDNAVSAQALNKLAEFYIKGGGGFAADEDFAKHFKTFGKYFQ